MWETATVGTHGRRTVLEPEWEEKGMERNSVACGDGDGGVVISYHHKRFPIYFIRNLPHYGFENRAHKHLIWTQTGGTHDQVSRMPWWMCVSVLPRFNTANSNREKICVLPLQ